jgi:mannose-6-phosphate isomerase-like protein (cupin superfamily)
MNPSLKEEVKDQDEILAIILRADYSAEGLHFFTPNAFSQQLAYMHHPAGKTIEAHCHVAQPRNIEYTQEVLVLRRGVLRVDFYRSDKSYLESRTLRAGDVILLAHGGHGFEVLEEIEMIEIKQGPYSGEGEKTRFPSVAREQLRFKE